ncbi:DUF3223 domain-containing protein [Pseudoalteromonas lipolytica]|uniref:DUF3223 domain-containing protein n=1 Tax=Pseudoalteromonas lipolytica TaxID=570156 RepID=UPI0030ADC4C1
MAKPITLSNGISFNSQTEAIEYFKKVLNSETEIARNHPEFSNILALYTRHPEFEWKSVSEDNVERFSIRSSGQFNTKCFHAIHYSSSEDADWSYVTAIKSKAKSNFQCFTDAARSLLESSEYKFRDPNFTFKCRAFIEEQGFSQDSFPNEWVSKPAKLQYRSTLSSVISSRFVDWYLKYDNK